MVSKRDKVVESIVGSFWLEGRDDELKGWIKVVNPVLERCQIPLNHLSVHPMLVVQSVIVARGVVGRHNIEGAHQWQGLLVFLNPAGGPSGVGRGGVFHMMDYSKVVPFGWVNGTESGFLGHGSMAWPLPEL